MNYLRLSIVFFICACSQLAWADDAVEACVRYRAKKAEVPVYEEPEETARVISRLTLGEHVCYVGEKDNFAIANWQVQHYFSTLREKDAKAPVVAYIRLVDLWEPVSGKRAQRKKGVEGFVSWLQTYYKYMRSGGVPEDGLMPYRPLMDLFEKEEISKDIEAKEPEASQPAKKN